jgi:hypothetical protein
MWSRLHDHSPSRPRQHRTKKIGSAGAGLTGSGPGRGTGTWSRSRDHSPSRPRQHRTNMSRSKIGSAGLTGSEPSRGTGTWSRLHDHLPLRPRQHRTNVSYRKIGIAGLTGSVPSRGTGTWSRSHDHSPSRPRQHRTNLCHTLYVKKDSVQGYILRARKTKCMYEAHLDKATSHQHPCAACETTFCIEIMLQINLTK